MKKYFILVGLLAVMSFFVLPVGDILSYGSSDAIAVKVLPNYDNYSVNTWYAMQGFGGSPSSLKVDDYEALRDGDTVYVGGSNVAGNKLYTNIYVLAQNVESDSVTNRIFDQIVGTFKLNKNLDDAGYCFKDEVVYCSSDGGVCGFNEQCVGVGSNQVCVQGCSYDFDCGLGGYCDSQKAEVIRDTKRMGDLADIRILIERYRLEHGYYPRLSSGTYLSGVTLSVWPSWNNTLARELGVPSLPVDPVNKIGDCGSGYGPNPEISPEPDVVTCWDEVNRVFADNNPSVVSVSLPDDSKVYMYKVINGGTGYELTMSVSRGESGFVPAD